MTKRKKKHSSKAQSSTTLCRNGLVAFQQGAYDRAIATWERVAQQTPDLRPTSALAEAYFRRGLNHLYGGSPDPAAGLRDLEQALVLKAGDPCYTYHVGLAYHRQGKLAQAVALYRQVRQAGGPFAARAAYPFAVAMLQDGKSPIDDPVWSDLSAEEQGMLRDASAFRRRPYLLGPDAPLLWRSLLALDNGQVEEARTGLEQVLANDPGRAEKAVAHYYSGVLAAQREEWEAAGDHWDRALATGLVPPSLAVNLGELSHRLAEQRLLDDDPAGALAAAQQAFDLNGQDKQLQALMSTAYQRLGFQAAQAGEWPGALERWELAAAVGGPSFRLAYNLALAHERVEDYARAGDWWREALRRRPRKADHTDAISDDQVARLWRQAAEAYRRAGDYEAAIQVYRHAIKWSPDNLAVRLALVEELMTDGRGQAAENELNRILERDPDNVPALLRLGEVIAETSYRWQRSAAPQYWQRVLELEPGHITACQLLADYFSDLAESAKSWGDYRSAIEFYRTALSYQQTNSQILASLGYCCFQTNQQQEAKDYLARALAHAGASLGDYDAIIRAWYNLDRPDLAWQAMSQAEAKIPDIPLDFYLFQAERCLKQHHADWARPWLERIERQAPPDLEVLGMIGELAVLADEHELGREYLNRSLAAGDYPGQIHLLLGIVEAKEERMKAAEKHWKEAERVARQVKDDELRERIEHARMIFSDPMGVFHRMMRDSALPPLLPLDLFKVFDDLDDEDDDDDELFWE